MIKNKKWQIIILEKYPNDIKNYNKNRWNNFRNLKYTKVTDESISNLVNAHILDLNDTKKNIHMLIINIYCFSNFNHL